MIFIDLSKYTRKDLSNILQIATQCDNIGYPLPCLFVEQVVSAHDELLKSTSNTTNMPASRPVRPPPPCSGCDVARWITFPCGSQGWECQGNKVGKCAALWLRGDK